MTRTTANSMRGRRAAFTTIELLVVIGIIALLTTITVVSIRSVLLEARVSSATNLVKAALANARALALKNNENVGVIFVVRWDPEEQGEQVVELWTIRPTGATRTVQDLDPAGQEVDQSPTDEYEPIPGVPVRPLPPGIKVAAPFYSVGIGENTLNYDDWVTQPHFPAGSNGSLQQNEHGSLLGVLFSPRGEVITRRLDGGAGRQYSWVDFNADGFLNDGATTGAGEQWQYDEPDDEPRISFAPFLSVYDDREAHEFFPDSSFEWIGPSNRQQRRDDLSQYINQNADRIHFNRYTGVVMR